MYEEKQHLARQWRYVNKNAVEVITQPFREIRYAFIAMTDKKTIANNKVDCKSSLGCSIEFTSIHYY